MTVSELIQALEDLDAPDAEIRLAFQPSWPLQYGIGDVVLDGGHVHDVDSDIDGGNSIWYCSDPDCGVEWDHEPLDHERGSDDAGTGIAYIGEAGQIYDAPYLPGSAANALGWGR